MLAHVQKIKSPSPIFRSEGPGNLMTGVQTYGSFLGVRPPANALAGCIAFGSPLWTFCIIAEFSY